jgi:diguanylate cyclase (GGDEF)-like protein
MAFYDTLTDLPNRALFHDRLRQAILQARHGGHLVAVLFLGIDRLKVINDTLGHSTGDQLLRAVAERLRSSVQERDTVARLSGDEFALVFASPASMQDAAQMARHMLTVLARPFYLNNHELYTSASIGIALYPTDTTDAELLVQYADVAMARAKNQGRNNYTFYTNTLHTRTLEWLKLENDLRKAIEWGNFCLHYQPQIDLRNGRIVGVEALVRWRHPQLGFLSPNRFIPIAEESGLIIPLGRWILHTACTQCRAWQLQGLPAVRVAVNLSALQLARAEIVSETTQILRDTGLEPPYLELELTESMLMHDAEATIATLYQLKQQGVSLAIDDFGTGYSSLSYLKRLPIDTLKIDASFIQDIPHNPDDAAIATTIINMAHNLDLRVIAEGVENESQEQFLFEHGCNEVQGYRYGRPTPASDLARMLADPHHYIPIHLNVSNGDSTTSIVRQHSN